MRSEDLDFLVQYTKLSKEATESLVEENLNEVLDAIAEKESLDGISTISFPVFTKLAVFKAAKKGPCGLDEKVYVADALAESIEKLPCESLYIIDNGWYDQRQAKHWLIMTGFFPEFIERKHLSVEPYLAAARVGFRRSHLYDLADHVYWWNKVLSNVRNYEWPSLSV